MAVADPTPDIDPVETGVYDILHPYQQESVHLGPSKISTFLGCPREYRYQYVDRLAKRGSGAAMLGSTVHKAIQRIHAMHWGPAHADEAAQFCLEVWQGVRDHSTDPDNPEIAKGLRDATDVWLPWYLTWQENQIDVVVEERFTFPVVGLSEGWEVLQGVTLQGTIDRVYREDGVTVLSDVKTGKRSPSAQDMETDLQLSLYSYAYQVLAGEMPGRIEILQLRQRQAFLAARTPEYLDHVMLDVVGPVAQQIRYCHETDWWPCNPRRQFGCAYCDYQSLCQVGQGCH